MLHTPKLPPDILAHYSLLCDNIMCSPHYSLVYENVLHSMHISSTKCHSFTDERGWGGSHLAVHLRFWSVKLTEKPQIARLNASPCQPRANQRPQRARTKSTPPLKRACLRSKTLAYMCTPYRRVSQANEHFHQDLNTMLLPNTAVFDVPRRDLVGETAPK